MLLRADTKSHLWHLREMSFFTWKGGGGGGGGFQKLEGYQILFLRSKGRIT